MNSSNPKLLLRFFTKVESSSDGCWLWKTGRVQGYGVFSIGRRLFLAHRFSFEIFRGKVPVGKELDHLCRVRHCVNPEHLEPVTKKENILRGIGFGAKNARKTRCDHGHPFNKKNTRYFSRDGGDRRDCRVCSLNRVRLHRLKNK